MKKVANMMYLQSRAARALARSCVYCNNSDRASVCLSVCLTGVVKEGAREPRLLGGDHVHLPLAGGYRRGDALRCPATGLRHDQVEKERTIRKVNRPAAAAAADWGEMLEKKSCMHHAFFGDQP